MPTTSHPVSYVDAQCIMWSKGLTFRGVGGCLTAKPGTEAYERGISRESAKLWSKVQRNVFPAGRFAQMVINAYVKTRDDIERAAHLFRQATVTAVVTRQRLLSTFKKLMTFELSTRVKRLFPAPFDEVPEAKAVCGRVIRLIFYLCSKDFFGAYFLESVSTTAGTSTLLGTISADDCCRLVCGAGV
jgi:hypothetical protein